MPNFAKATGKIFHSGTFPSPPNNNNNNNNNFIQYLIYNQNQSL